MIAVEQKSSIIEEPRGLYHPVGGGGILCTPQVTEEIIALSWLRFSSEKLLARTFNEGPVSLKWFIERIYNPDVRMLAFLREDENKQLYPLGLSWINHFTEVGNPPVFRKAEVGEAFFRKVSPRDTIWCARMALWFCFETLGLDVVHGMTAEPNKAAVKYARRVGFNVTGPIPCSTVWMDESGVRQPCGSYISAMTKEMWEARDWK